MNLDKIQYELVSKEIKYNNIFLLSDIHFGVRSNSLEWLQNQLQFFEEFYIPFLEKNVRKGDILMFIGDFFDSRQFLDINVMNVAIDIVIKLSEILPLHMLTGNHDLYKKNDTDVNSLRPFRYINNVVVYEKPAIVTNGESKILILPWIGNKEKEEGYAKYNKVDYIFAHTDIAGFYYDNGKQILNGANISNVRGIKKLFSGHIHKRQEGEKSIYIGSPYHTKRSDIANEKGIYVLNPKTNQLQFHKNTISSIFQRIHLEELMEYTLQETYDLLNNNYTDIVVPDKYIHLFNLTKFIELLGDCPYKKIETRGEKVKVDDELIGIIDGEEVKDILTLLEISIDDLVHNIDFLIKLKLLNKEYYTKAYNEENELI